LREAGVTPELLDAETLRERPCHRLKFDTDAGQLVLWIDQENSILHRMQYPTNELKQSLADQGVEEVVMTADFEGAKLDGPIDEGMFSWPKSDDEVLVRYLVTPPDMQRAPHVMLGKPAPEFTMTTADGEEEKSTDLKGKIVVLDVWATWCPYCIQGMPKFGEAYKADADNDQVRYIALSVDDASVSDKQLTGALDQTGAKVPWARVTGDDPFRTIREGFQLPGIPAYAILDKENRVQFVHIGADLDLAKDLPQRVAQIAEGRDLAAETKALWERLQEQYRQEIQVARVDAASAMIEIARSDITERSEPESLKIEELWKNTELKAPGNILVVASNEGSPVVYVIDDYQSIVELDMEGKVVAKHGDGLPEEATITYLATAADGDDQRHFVAASVGEPQFFVFDDQWKLKLTYPEESTASVYDVLPVDLDGDGQLELCVGYYGEAGVHAVTMDGKRLWRNRWLTNVGDLAATQPDDDGQRRLLCVHSFGTLGILDSQGESLPTVQLPNRAVTHIVAADLDDEAPSELAAITVDLSGQRSMVGLSEDGEVLWQHLLPPGEHETPIEVLTAAKLFADQPGHWFAATPDGSIHIVSADGAKYDKFSTGEKLTGLAGLRADDQGVLLIASDKGVTAMSIEPSE
jgi:thiol-disulfide isomerase/thioredoxin